MKKKTYTALVLLMAFASIFSLHLTAAETATPAEKASPSDTEKPAGNAPAKSKTATENAADTAMKETTPTAEDEADVHSLLHSAQQYELADELYSAQSGYQDALLLATKLAADKKESRYNYALSEFITEKLLELTLRTADNRGFLKTLTKVSEQFKEESKTTPPPIIQNRFDWAKIQLYMRMGKAEKAAEIAQTLAQVTQWLICEGDSFTGRVISFTAPDGLLSPGEFFAKKDWKKTRLHTIITSKEKQLLAVRLGFNSDTRVFINGYEVHAEDNGAATGFDRTVFAAELNAGDNLLTIELNNAENSPEGFLRITAPNGYLLENTSVKVTQDSATLEKLWQVGNGQKAQKPEVDIDTGAQKYLASLIKTDPADHNSAYYLGYLLQRRQNFGPHSKEARELLMKAIRRQPDAGIYYLAFASAADESARLKPDQDENLKRMMLQKAISVDDKNIAALCLLGNYYLSSQNSPTRAQEYANLALKKNPSSISANVLQGLIYLRRNWATRALKLARELSKRNRSFPQVCSFRALAEMAAGTPQSAESAWSIQLSANRINYPLTRRLSTSLRNRGESKRAQMTLNQFLKLRPNSSRALTVLARMQLQTNKTTEANKTIQKLLQNNPGSAAALKLAAQFAQTQNDQKTALSLYAKSLEADPGQPQLRDYLAYQKMSEPGLLSAIPNLAEFASSFQDYRPPAGKNTAIFLTETADDIHEDGTRQRSYHRVAKIFNNEGINEYTRIPVWHDATNEVVKINQMRVLHPDGSTSVGQSMDIPRNNDRRIKLIIFPGLQAGDVVEISYDIIQTKPGFFGDYFGVNYIFRQFAPTLKSLYVLRYPKSRKLYFHQTPSTPKAEETAEDGSIVKTWEMKNLPALEMLPLMPPLQEMSPTVQVSSFANWDDMAKWYWHLIKSQNIATEAIRTEVKKITEKKKTPREKLSAIYQWVSKNVRNNAWEFGIHGYKPYNAEAIFTRRFGDCKDKATLVNVMAREAGFEAWPVLLKAIDPSADKAGRGEENLELPLISHFNHCISMVEAGGERYYLDPTIGFQTIDSQSMTDREAGAVIVRAAGAEIVKLPAHTPQSNLWQEALRVEVNARGTANLNFMIKSSGQPALFLRSWFRNPATWDNVMRAIGTQLYGRVSSTSVNDFVNLADEKDTVGLNARVRITDYAQAEKKSLHIAIPKIIVSGEIGKGGAVPEKLSAFATQTMRDIPLILPTLFRIKRSITIEWPDGWRLDQALEPIKLDYPFGTLNVKYTLNDNLLQIEYSLELKKLKISPKEYREFRRFCLQADRAASQKLEVKHD